MRIIKEQGAAPLTLHTNTALSLPESEYTPYITEQLKALLARARGTGKPCRSITMSIGIPDALRARFGDPAKAKKATFIEDHDDYVENLGFIDTDPAPDPRLALEEYAICFEEEIKVFANTPTGLLRALATIMEQSDKGKLCEQAILDAPACVERGYRVYLPGKRTMAHFIEMLDFLVYYKFNALIVEIGGAMEYKRRPILNQKWVEFCTEMSEYSGKTTDAQDSQHWPKDSFHIENGDGGFLTQQECRTLAAECARRGIELIPECPTLSHSDYICLAYPELAERQNDPYPDTYCPSHPDTYKVVFDILDEVIEVFRPKRINIGHDEFYSVAICERCQGQDPAALYVKDITTIRNHLHAQGVTTMMWSEKLLKARTSKGEKTGGWYEEKLFNGVPFRVPAMFRCADHLPKDIIHLHWYWPFGEHLDDEYHARDYQVVFGNFGALSCKSFRKRIKRGVKGAFVSNWSSCIPEYMQRNGQYLALVCAGYALWSDTFDSDQAEPLRARALNELYAKHCATVKNPLKVVHAAHHSVVPKTWGFWCGRFIEDSVYLLGHYILTYDDGTTAQLPVKLGTNIACRTPTDREVREAAYSTIALRDETGCLFEHTYDNPHPDKRITSVTYRPCAGKEQIKVEYSFPTLS